MRNILPPGSQEPPEYRTEKALTKAVIYLLIGYVIIWIVLKALHLNL